MAFMTDSYSISIGRYVLLILSILSILSSVCTCTSMLISPQELRKRIVVQIACCIAVSDIMSTLGTAVGTGLEKGLACNFQAFIIMFNLTSSFWAATAIHILYRIVRKPNNDQIIVLGYREHMLCWIVPLILTILPFLLSSSSPAPMGRSPWANCYAVDIEKEPGWYFLAALVTAIFPLAIALLVMIVEVVLILISLRAFGQNQNDSRFQFAKKLSGYVIIVVALQLCPVFFANGQYGDDGDLFLLNCALASTGIFNSFWFWYVETKVRKHVLMQLAILR